MKDITFKEALVEAMDEEMARDNNVFIMGLDVGKYGGAFGATEGLYKKYGNRVIDMPISEAGYTGAAVGAAMTGLRPIVELQISDWATIASDQIVNNGANMTYLFLGKVKVPLVLRLPSGGYLSYACQHSHSWESWFSFIPGLKVLYPSNPYDAKGLLKTAIRDDNIVIFLEHKRLYNMTGKIPTESYSLPIGKADVKREGKDITIVTYAYLTNLVLQAAEILGKEGIDCEVIDLMTLKPLDEKTITDSLKKTNRLLVAQESWRNCSIASEIVSIATEKCFDYLDSPPRRLTAKEAPIPFSPPLEEYVLPSIDDILESVKLTIK